ncbi:MAG: thioredoxin family protein [Acidobacteriota bacterium]|nr:thioredoxin family protein [Acidobacteriota bacterium]
MTTLQILGSGCTNCVRLANNVEAAAKELGMDFKLEKVTDIQSIVRAGVMKTPALLVDGQVKLYGRVPNVDELKTILA